ncbi:MAG: S8 family serine peptidase [Bacteroidetes bacterium]|nr:S8 family serine peptidase [Bacteroidota bacterium]
MKKIILYTALLLSLPCFINAQHQTMNLDGKLYSKENNRWYVTNSETGERFLVNTRSITVKLKGEMSKIDMITLNKSLGIKVKRENILGYIDLELPEDSNFSEYYELMKNTGLFENIDINSYGEMLTVPNDPWFGYQYYLNHSTRPDINAPEGWNFTSNFGNGIIIAVIDQGVFLNHPDLIENKWPGLGWDYVINNTPDPNFGENHGTHVAGIAAAATSNSVGIAGVAGGWGPSLPGSQIMALRIIEQVSDTHSVIHSDAVDDAILFAVSNGAKIINMSFKVDELSAIKDAIDFAYNTSGCLLIAAGGNDASATTPYFPARDNTVMAVAGLKWKFWDHLGNTGYQIEIASPGEDIFSTIYSGLPDSKYGNMTGTSQATPQVSGAGALLWSDYPGLTNFDIRNILKKTAFTNFSTYSPIKFGSGLLKIDQALSYAANLPGKPTGISIIATIGRHPTISWNPVPDADSYNVYRSEHGRRMELYVATNTTGTSWTDNQVIVSDPKFKKRYYYRVTTVDGNYESAVSDDVSCASNTLWKNNAYQVNINTYEYKLLKNYPNPFNPLTTIKYSLKEEGLVKIKVFDILGSEVVELVNEIKPEGEHTVVFKTDNLPSGIYFYSINSGSFKDTKKMLLLR